MGEKRVYLGEKAKLRLGGETEGDTARETRAGGWERSLRRGLSGSIDGSSRGREGKRRRRHCCCRSGFRGLSMKPKASTVHSSYRERERDRDLSERLGSRFL